MFYYISGCYENNLVPFITNNSNKLMYVTIPLAKNKTLKYLFTCYFSDVLTVE